MDALHHIDVRLLGYALLVLAGVASSLLARRFGAPLLLVFLVIGMLLGVDGIEKSTNDGLSFDGDGLIHRCLCVDMFVLIIGDMALDGEGYHIPVEA